MIRHLASALNRGNHPINEPTFSIFPGDKMDFSEILFCAATVSGFQALKLYTVIFSFQEIKRKP
jgi:hypothetical protein